MKKKLLCAVLAFMLVILCGCSTEEIITEGFALLFRSKPISEMEVGEQDTDRDYFIGKLPCNYVYYVDYVSYMNLYKIPEDWVGEYDIYTKKPIMKGHYIFANYTDNAIAFCREFADGTIRWIGFDFNTGESKFYDSFEEISSELGLDEKKWFKCCYTRDELSAKTEGKP